MKMCLLPKTKFLGRGFQMLEPEHDIQTYRQTRLKILPIDVY